MPHKEPRGTKWNQVHKSTRPLDLCPRPGEATLNHHAFGPRSSMALEHPQDQTDSDQVPQLPALPGMEDLVAPPLAKKGSGVRPDFEEESRQLPVVVVRRADGGDVDSQEETDVLRGRNFGGYELVQKIGQGGMGMVYKARQVSLDRTVAIKILSKALSENAEFIKRFEREAKSIGRRPTMILFTIILQTSSILRT